MSAFINLTEAIQMTSDYRTHRRAIVDAAKDEEVLPICETFEREHVEAILQQNGCVGLRAYFGVDEDQNVKLVLVGVNSKDEDMYSGTNSLLDRSTRCPDICPPDSPLNS